MSNAASSLQGNYSAQVVSAMAAHDDVTTTLEPGTMGLMSVRANDGTLLGLLAPEEVDEAERMASVKRIVRWLSTDTTPAAA